MVDIKDKVIVSIWKHNENYQIIIESVLDNVTNNIIKLTECTLSNKIEIKKICAFDECEAYRDKYNLGTLVLGIPKPLVAMTLYGFSRSPDDFDLDYQSNDYNNVFQCANSMLVWCGYDDYYRPDNPYIKMPNPNSYDDFIENLSEIKLTQLKQHPETNIEESYYQTKIIQRINKRFIAAHGITLVGEIGSIIFSSILLSERNPIDFGIQYIHDHYHTIASTVGGCLITLSVISFFALNVFYFDSMTFKEYVPKVDTTFEDAVKNNQIIHVQI